MSRPVRDLTDHKLICRRVIPFHFNPLCYLQICKTMVCMLPSGALIRGLYDS